MKTRTHRIKTWILVGAVAGLASVGSVYAYSSANSNGTYQICAQNLYLRNAPSGPAIDTLKGGTHFEVTSGAGGNWVKGYSYWAQKSGYVQNGWFC